MSKIEYTLDGKTYCYDDSDLSEFDGKITGELIKDDSLEKTLEIDTVAINNSLEDTLVDFKPIEEGEINE